MVDNTQKTNEEITIVEAKNQIKLIFPEFMIDSFEHQGEGMDSAAFLANGEYVFRFAKHDQTSGMGGGIINEIKLLPLLERHLPVSIPYFEYIGVQTNGLPVVGYRKITGNQLSKDLSVYTEEEKLIIFRTISDFLQAMHVFPVEIAQKHGVEVKDLMFYQDLGNIEESQRLLGIIRGFVDKK